MQKQPPLEGLFLYIHGGEVKNTHELWEAICESIPEISKWNTEIKAVYAQKFRQAVVDVTF